MKDIVIIAPYKNLYDLSKEVIEEQNYENIDVVIGDLNDGLKIAKHEVDLGTRVIISRGGTYNLLKANLSIPVVEIKLTAFDILRSYGEIKDYKTKIAIVGYKNVIYGYDELKTILGTQTSTTEIYIEEEETVESRIADCISQGIKIFVGDNIVCRTAEKFGCKSYLITSTKDSILSSIEEAIRILEASRFEKEMTERLSTLIDSVHDGVMSIDKDDRITVFNSIAQKIFNLKREDVIGKRITDVIDNDVSDILTSKSTKIGEIIKVGKTKINLNSVPLTANNKTIGAMATFQDITELQDLEKRIRIKLLESGFVAKYSFDDIIYKSTKMKACIDKAKKFSNYHTSILIEGQSGVGKELFAQSIHNYSDLRNGPFVALNCAAIQPSLIESELFGYVEGAFTGAKKGVKAGVFELAHGGTVFLDEIAEIPMDLQGRFLRVLQEKEVMRIGDDKVIPIDVRIISASNKKLRELVKEGKFRSDLYYRIGILKINIPSLNERKEDIILLTEHFIKKFAKLYSKKIKKISDSSLEYLMDYDYEGNVRELEGIVEKAVILCEGDEINIEDIIVDDENINQAIEKYNIHYFNIDYGVSLKKLNEEYIKYVLSKENNNYKRASEIVEIDRSTLWRRINKK